MALAISKLGTSLFSNANASPYTWATATPAASAGIVVCVVNSAGSAVPTPTIDNSGGSNPSWLSGLWTQEVTDVSSGIYAMTIFSGTTIASPASDTFDVTVSGSPTGCIVIVVQVTGQDATDFLLQPELFYDSSADTSESMTLNSALSAATSACLAFFAHNANEATTPTGGETEIEDGSHNLPNRGCSAQYKINDTVSAVSWTTSSTSYVAGMEIKEAAGAAAASLIWQPPLAVRSL